MLRVMIQITQICINILLLDSRVEIKQLYNISLINFLFIGDGEDSEMYKRVVSLSISTCFVWLIHTEIVEIEWNIFNH